MLIRFRVSNHRSIRDQQELSLVASSALKEEQDPVSVVPFGDIALLPAAAIYGANASGKTNVLKAINFAANAVCRSQTNWKPDQEIRRTPFRFEKKSAFAPTQFEFDLLIDSVRYTYGFAIDSRSVVGEYLYAYPRGRQQVWFNRNHAGEIRFGKNLTGENRTIWNLTRPNSLFLSAAAQNNHQLLMPIFKWFAHQVRFAYPHNKDARLLASVELAREDRGNEVLLKLLSQADLGIVGIRVHQEEPTKQYTEIMTALRSFLPEGLPKSMSVLWRAQLVHKLAASPEGIPLELEAESDGTRALFALGKDLADVLANGGLLCVDELEESLHPLLAIKVVSLFSDPKINRRGAQLLFTTHNTILLARHVLRRDQIWFTEKDASGVTRLYSLTDFHPRRDENLETGYLQGRYGAIPFLETTFSTDFLGKGPSCAEERP